MSANGPYIEIGQNSLKVLHGEESLEFTLERGENGRLTEASKEDAINRLKGFLRNQGWKPRQRALCAIGARGVSLRQLSLPAAGKDELQRLLRMQIESEFPLSPDELAWGYRAIPQPAHLPNGAPQQHFIVAAVKKEVLEDYARMLGACGLSPVFTLAALARNHLFTQPQGTYAVLSIGRKASELMVVENGVPLSLRTLPWGGEDITRAIQDKLSVSHDEAESLKLKLDQGPFTNGDVGRKITEAVEGALDSLASGLKGNWARLYVTGRSTRQKDLAPQLAKRLRDQTGCDSLELFANEGRSAALLGLKKSSETNGAEPQLVFQVKEIRSSEPLSRPAPWKWVGITAALLLLLLSMPYAEAFLLKAKLAKRLTAVKADKGRLAMIDRELEFLEYLKKNQSPYLDALLQISRAAPQGTRFEAISMNRRGDVSLRGSMRDGNQVVEFRTKLINCGFFSLVTVDDQTPTPDRQKVNIRLTAQWKPASAREALFLDSFTNDPVRSPGFSGPMMPEGFPGGMPGIFPPGGPPPMPSSSRPGPPTNRESEKASTTSKKGPTTRVIRQGDGPIVLPPGVVLPGEPVNE